jgi:hypothetical protein
MELLIVIVVIVFGIFSRNSRTGDAWFTWPCLYCRQKIATSASSER